MRLHNATIYHSRPYLWSDLGDGHCHPVGAVVGVKEVMEMKRTILVVISCLLLLGLLLAGCGGGGVVTGEMIGVWPKGSKEGSNVTFVYYYNVISRVVAGINYTDVEYTGITDFIIPDEYCQAWTGLPCP